MRFCRMEPLSTKCRQTGLTLQEVFDGEASSRVVSCLLKCVEEVYVHPGSWAGVELRCCLGKWFGVFLSLGHWRVILRQRLRKKWWHLGSISTEGS